MANDKKTKKPGDTTEARQSDLVLLAYNVAEEQLKSKNVSSQVLTHFLKLGSDLAAIEKEKLKQQTLLLEAKTKEIKASVDKDKMLDEALKAIREYRGDDIYDESDIF